MGPTLAHHFDPGFLILQQSFLKWLRRFLEESSRALADANRAQREGKALQFLYERLGHFFGVNAISVDETSFGNAVDPGITILITLPEPITRDAESRVRGLIYKANRRFGTNIQTRLIKTPTL